MLEVKDLYVRYGNIEALHGISFHVKPVHCSTWAIELWILGQLAQDQSI